MQSDPAEKKPFISKMVLLGLFKFLFLVGLLVYWVLIIYCNPLGLESGTEEGSTRVFRALGLPVYGVGSDETHRHVAVVTINDDSFQNKGSVFQGQRWPLSYAMQQKLLLKMLNASPAALFVDVRFTKENSNQTNDLSLDQAFSPVIQLANEKHIPIFFARGDSDNNELIRLNNRQYDLPPPLRDYEVYSNGTNGTNHYPLWGEVNQKNNATDRDSEQKEVFLNPAMALYEALCRDRWKGSSLCAQFKGEGYFRKARNTHPLIVKWGLIPDSDQHFVSQVDEDTQELSEKLKTSFLTRGVVAGEHALVAISPKFAGVIKLLAKRNIVPNDLDNKGFYPLTIGAQSLFDWEPHDYVQNTLDIDNNYISDYLKNRVVFYGTDLRDGHDDEKLDGIGYMPGVIVHAMAFDNLVTYGRSYYYVNGKTVYGIPLLKVVNFVVWLCLALYIVFIEARYPRVNEDSSEENKDASPSKVSIWLANSWLGSVGRSIKAFFLLWRRWAAVKDGEQLDWKIRSLVSLFVFGGVTGIGIYLGDRWEGALFLGFVISFYAFLFLRGKAGFLLNIMFIAAIEGVFFQINVTWLRWGNTDWLALALLWTMAQSGEIATKIHEIVGNMLKSFENYLNIFNKKRRIYKKRWDNNA